VGASSWHYETAYSDDPDAALQQLRNQVFESGRYGDPFINVSIWSLRSLPWSIILIMLVAKCFYAITSFVGWMARGFRSPRSIEEAIEIAAESGTHSILDIQGISQSPGFAVAWPLSPKFRKQFYGSEEPTVEDLDRVGWVAAAEDLDRWQAVYFPVYADGVPTKLVFVGCSGD
jgi:hypothetical protein